MRTISWVWPRKCGTLSKIAATTGVSLATLQRLNPNINPQALQPGTPIRLR